MHTIDSAITTLHVMRNRTCYNDVHLPMLKFARKNCSKNQDHEKFDK